MSAHNVRELHSIPIPKLEITSTCHYWQPNIFEWKIREHTQLANGVALKEKKITNY